MIGLADIGAVLPLHRSDQALMEALDEIPSETTPAERRFLYHFFARIWPGERHVCEVGPFLGGTTRAIAMGMLANPRRHPSTKLYTFDRFTDYKDSDVLLKILQPLFDKGVLASELKEKLQRSVGFKEVFFQLHQGRPYASLISAHERVLPDRPDFDREDERIFRLEKDVVFDAVFIDGCKSWYATKYFMREIGDKVNPGTYFLFQDYGWHTCFWIASFVHIMDECFDMVAYVDNTYAFQLIREISPEQIDRMYPDTPDVLGRTFFDELFPTLQERAIRRNDVYGVVFHALHHAAALAYLGYLDDARAKITELAAQPYAAQYQALIRQALRSPTYTPDGPIYLLDRRESDSRTQSASPNGDAIAAEVERPEIIRVWLHVQGVDLTIRCRRCGHIFESHQPTIAGIAFGKHHCPQCQAVYEIEPEELIEALERHLPSLGYEEMQALNEEVIHVAGSWYRTKPMAELLTYKGVNLGEPTERELAAFIMQGLYPASGGEGSHER